MPWDAGTTIIVSAVEHPAVLQPARAAAVAGADVRIVPVGPDGEVEISAFVDAVSTARDQLLVSIQWANSETGVIQPIQAIADAARAIRSVLVHSDAVQAYGRIPIDLSEASV